MKIPKYVERLIQKRENLANELDTVMHELDEWLDSHDIETSPEDTHEGAELYMNPEDSANRIRQAILNKR